METRITIRGRVPSKKNGRRAIYVGGRTIMIASRDHEAWHADAMAQVREQYWPKQEVFAGPVAVEIEFWAPNRVKADLSNKAESIMDLLVDSGVITDDNWWEVQALTLTFAGISRDDPRAEIKVEKAETRNTKSS